MKLKEMKRLMNLWNWEEIHTHEDFRKKGFQNWSTIKLMQWAYLLGQKELLEYGFCTYDLHRTVMEIDKLYNEKRKVCSMCGLTEEDHKKVFVCKNLSISNLRKRREELRAQRPS